MKKPDDSCIDHQQKGDNKGYGRCSFGGRVVLAHRLAFAISRGISLDEIKGMVVRHECDNPRCVNPSHLRIGSHKENSLDMMTRGRCASTKLTEEQVIEIRRNCKPSRMGRPTEGRPNGYAAYAKRFGVTSRTVMNAYLGITFNHLTEAIK